MKRIIGFFIVFVMLFSLAACARPEAKPGEIRVGSLNGPTTMGLVDLMDRAEKGGTEDAYAFTRCTQADELAAKVAGGQVDIALVPANLAAVLYKRTNGAVAVIDVNTLGVLYCVTGDEKITSIRDLAGKTVVLTGQGTTPEHTLRYLLDKYGITDCTLEFRSEAGEVAAVLAGDPGKIAVLPQPFATSAQMQNTALREAFSLSDAWDALGTSARMLTGVTIVRRDFLEEYPQAVKRFMAEHKKSAGAAAEVIAPLVVRYGIIAKEPVANRAIPKCGITYLDGAEMKAALEGYLAVLHSADPASVGGQLPGSDFYYVG